MGKYILLILLFTYLVSCEISNGKQEKPYVSYYSNDSIKWEGTLSNGLRSGEWTMYDSLGNTLLLYRYKNDTLIYREYYGNNRVASKEELMGEDIKHGETVTYYEDGVVESITNYIQNQQYGPQKFYYENGQVRLKYTQDSVGMKEFKQFYPNGNLFAESENPEDGIVTFYDSVGSPKVGIEYVNSVIKDTVKVYN